jgi:hypothetical protein
MNSTFKQFKKLKIPLIDDTIKLMTNKDHLLKTKHANDLRKYEFCVVGTVRQQLGLSNKYEYGSSYCAKCIDLANSMPSPIELYENEKQYSEDANYINKFTHERTMQEEKEKYEGLLLELKQHLILVHGKPIN